MMSKIMDLVLETDRLLLRAITHEDADALFEMDKNPNVHQYLWNKPVVSIDEIHNYINNIRNQYIKNGIGRFAVIIKETNSLIGWAGIKFITEIENGHTNFYDFGYRLNEKYWRKGYATEASYKWLEYGFNTMEIETMFASAQVDNEASNKILQKIGMN